MAAILRVKRRHDDEPSNALVISCKRQKTTEYEETEAALSASLATVAKFAGTVKKQEDSIGHIIQTYGKDELKENFKQHPVDILNKARETVKQASIENRYKVVNCFRSLDSSNHDPEENTMTVIDVEDSKSMAKDTVEKDDNYVYDLYYVQTEKDVHFDEMVSVLPYDQELVFDNYKDNGYPEAECESEDSNSESNWRNDYPDSNHSEKSIDEDDMREAVMNMRLDDGSDLSNDEDDFVYAVDEADVESYGYKYAKYKAMVLEELGEDEENHLSDYSGICMSEDSEEEYDDFD